MRVDDTNEYLIREFYASVAHINKGMKVTKICNLKVRFDQHTLSANLGFKDVQPREYMEKCVYEGGCPTLAS